MAEVKMTGMDDLRKAVEELTSDLRRKVVIGALRDAARPIVKAAKSLVPVRTGLVRSRIGVFTSKVYKGQNGVLGVYVTVRKEKGRRIKGTKVKFVIKQNDPFYWKFLELGTKKMAKSEFLQPAAETAYPESIEIFKRRIGERIAKANRRKP